MIKGAQCQQERNKSRVMRSIEEELSGKEKKGKNKNRPRMSECSSMDRQ